MKIAVQFPIFAYGIRMLRAKVQMHSRISNQIRHTTFSVLPLDGGMWGLWITSSSLRNKLHGNFLSVAVFFFLFNCLFFFSFLFCAQMHGTTSAEQKIKTVFHLLFLLLRYLDLHKIFLHDCVRKSTIQPPRSQRLPALRTVMC